MSFYVYSSLAASVKYCKYSEHKPEGRGIDMEVDSVTVIGATGVMIESKTKGIHTPFGVVTEVDDEKMEWLKDNHVFKMHQKAGFIIIDAKKHKVEKIYKDLKPLDISAPRTPDHFKGNPKLVGVNEMKSESLVA